MIRQVGRTGSRGSRITVPMNGAGLSEVLSSGCSAFRLLLLPNGVRQLLFGHFAPAADVKLASPIFQLGLGAGVEPVARIPGTLAARVRGTPLLPALLVDSAGRDFLGPVIRCASMLVAVLDV